MASEAKAHLLVFTPDAKENGSEGVKAYLESGEAADIDKGYKTSIRDKWWVIPSIKLSDALFLRRNNLYRKKATADEILDYTDEIILRQGAGLSADEVKLTRAIRHKIINRRLTRETLEMPVEKKQTAKDKHL